MKSPRLVGLIVAAAAMVAALTAPRISLAGPPDIDEGREISCLALTIYHEARGESERGKLAVGHVVMNRTRSGLFPADVCDVVKEGGQQYHRCQFSWWCDGLSDRPKDEAALRESLWLAEQIYYGCTRDPTAGALWYHSTEVKPSWSKSLGPGKRIDRQVFYRGDLNRLAPIAASLTAQTQCPPATPAHASTILAGG
jgi:spore germination cell wall hydrolase CwlJ-like protein